MGTSKTIPPDVRYPTKDIHTKHNIVHSLPQDALTRATSRATL